MDASLTGICAAAFALEALSRELEELGLLPPATVQAWTKNRPSDAAVTLEVLKVAVDPKGMVNHLLVGILERCRDKQSPGRARGPGPRRGLSPS